MKKNLLLILGMLIVTSIYSQQTITLKDGKVVDKVLSTVPTRDVKILSDGVIVTYYFSSAILQKDDLFEESWWWKIDGFGFEEEDGKPSVLSRIDQLSIPHNASAEIEILESTYKDFSYTLTPAHKPLTDSGNDFYSKENVKPIDISLGIYPTVIAEIKDKQCYRGIDILNVKISPIQYDVKNKIIRAYTKIKYKVTYSFPAHDYTDKPIPTIAVDDNFLANTTINTQPRITESLTQQNIQDYLIISVPKYAAAVNALAEWKRILGFNVHVTLKNTWTNTEVKKTVQDLYTQNKNLYYLLIIGDQEDVPASYSTHGEAHHVTDLWYGCMDGSNDFTPDIYRGRLSVSSTNEALSVVNKIIQYERNPITTKSFYDKGINCAFFQDKFPKDNYADRRFAQTSENVRDYLQGLGKTIQRIYYTDSSVTPTHWNRNRFSNGEPIPAELRKPSFLWQGKDVDITSAINNGAFYVLHRDHGAVWGWGDPQYTRENVNSLSNSNKLPVVFSMNCLTGKFNDETPCFAETFLRKTNGGCVGIFAATEVSMSGYNDVLTGGIFDAIWPYPGLRIVMPSQTSTGLTPTPTYQLGQILDQGFARMTEIFGANALYTRYTKELFHCFGDPSMQIYTDTPTAFANVSINRNLNTISVSLVDTTAKITFYDPSSGTVASYIGDNVVYTTDNPQDITVCISGHNKIPYIQEGQSITTTFIQNETIIGPKSYTGSVIKVGSEVTTTKPYGPVIVKSGEVRLTADKIEINPNTTVTNQAEFKIIIK